MSDLNNSVLVHDTNESEVDVVLLSDEDEIASLNDIKVSHKNINIFIYIYAP